MAKHGRYNIVRKVADGGMAEIFLATQLGREGFQKPVILKRIHSTIYADPQFRNMFIDEAHISMSLVAQQHRAGAGPRRRRRAATSWCWSWSTAGTWGACCSAPPPAGTPLPRELGLYITAEVCRALAYAHGKTDGDSGRSASSTATSARTTSCCPSRAR